MKNHLRSFAFALASSGAIVTGGAAAAAVTSRGVTAAFLSAEHIKFPGKLFSGTEVRDRNGQHLLVLSRRVVPSQELLDPDRDERAEIRATYYSAVNAKWSQDWQIADFSDCPGWDFNAAFVPNTTMISDLNNDGIAQITVAYTLMCRGDISADRMKVILRRGDEKLALRGDVEPVKFGAEFVYGKPVPDQELLLPKNAEYKKHLERVWRIAVQHHQQ